MPRPRQCRLVSDEPLADYFKPRGIPLSRLDEVRLSVEGLEALRLADVENLTASVAAEHMRISRHTFGRVLAEARRVVALALTRGSALRIAGGHYALDDETTGDVPGNAARGEAPDGSNNNVLLEEHT